MKTPFKINDLMKGSRRLQTLTRALAAREEVAIAVRSALPEALAERIASAGLEAGCLTVGVVGAAWASRLRYVTSTLKSRVGAVLGVEVERVRIRVVPPSRAA